jgi:hypothetical protein
MPADKLGPRFAPKPCPDLYGAGTGNGTEWPEPLLQVSDRPAVFSFSIRDGILAIDAMHILEEVVPGLTEGTSINGIYLGRFRT